MKKYFLIVTLAVLIIGAFLTGSWYGGEKSSRKSTSQERRILYYVDPMNPSHTSNEPGLAPCGMKMEPVYAEEPMQSDALKNASSFMPGTVKISPEKQQLIGVRVGSVEKKPLLHTIRLLGRVTTDEDRTYVVNATVDGWITEVFPKTTGSFVKKNETLAKFYSPDFLSAEQGLLFAMNAKDRVQNTGNETAVEKDQITQFNINLQQYIDSLKNLGMGDLQIKEMLRTREFTENVNITPPADGFIIKRNAYYGQRFAKGEVFYWIADLSRVWILADLYENEVQFIQPGATADISLPHQRKTFQATVSDVLPQFDTASRTLKVRLDVDNPEFVLLPDMFVDVEFPVSLPETVTVPVDAIIDSGLRKTVFVDRGNGFFEPRIVETGWYLGNQVEIVKGLMPGEQIVISGTFLIDSESRMKLAASGIHGVLVRDPICDMVVDEEKARIASLKTEYGEMTYYFCSDFCKQQFEQDPERFVQKLLPEGSRPDQPQPPLSQVTKEQ
jgi:RND family efflux transporter MFP subunit